MILSNNAVQGFISRDNSSWFDPTTDWTKMFYAQFTTTPAGGVALWVYADDITYANPYIWIGSSPAGSNDIKLEVYNGSTTTATTVTTLTNGTNFHLAIRYSEASHLIELIRNSVVIGSTTANLDSFTPKTFEYHLNEGDSDGSVVAEAYERFYQRALTLTEITAEAASIIPVDTDDLLSSSPLQTSVDLTDHSLQQLPFIASGTVSSTSYLTTLTTNDPLLSVVAGTVNNTNQTNALTVYTTTATWQDPVSGTNAQNRWYKLTPSASRVHGFLTFGDLTVYRPQTRVYQGLTNAIGGTTLINGNPNTPLQFYVDTSSDIYVEARRISTTVSMATVTVSVVESLNRTVPPGTLFVNDASDTFPLCLMDEETGYPIRFIQPYSGGEHGIMLTNGKQIMGDLSVNGVKIWSASFTAVTTAVTPTTGYDDLVGGNRTSGWAVKLDNPPKFVSISDDGTVGGTTYAMSNSGLRMIGANNANTKVYNIRNATTNQPVRVFDVVSNTYATTDLAAGITNYEALINMITLEADDSVFIPYRLTGTTSIPLVRQYGSTGSTIRDYVATTSFMSASIEKIAHGTNSDFFWVWQQPTSEFSVFTKVDVSTGGIAHTTGNVVKFNDGQSQQVEGLTPTRFGHSFSCIFLVVPGTAISPVSPGSGIYFLDFGLRHDVLWVDASIGTTTAVKIP